MNVDLNELIDKFITVNDNNIKQRDDNWYKLMGTTIGGSEIASLMGLSPYSNFYKLVESKIEICKGIISNKANILACWWGTIFEDVITSVIEIELGNSIKGNNICIQKYEGHRNSPDGYIVANFYEKDNMYHLWTSELSTDLISLQMIVLLEFKCPIARKITGDIPIYYKPQLLSGLAVSSIADKGLFIEALFKKCSVNQLGNNPYYDSNFHSKYNTLSMPIAWGVIPIYTDQINDILKEIYENVFEIDYEKENEEIIDLGDVSSSIFQKIMNLINTKQLTTGESFIEFPDGRTNNKIITNAFAILPWKIFDISYVFVDREPLFIESIYPSILRVHEVVKESLENNTYEKTKINNICDNIYN
jgi:hypothetical protein